MQQWASLSERKKEMQLCRLNCLLPPGVAERWSTHHPSLYLDCRASEQLEPLSRSRQAVNSRQDQNSPGRDLFRDLSLDRCAVRTTAEIRPGTRAVDVLQEFHHRPTMKTSRLPRDHPDAAKAADIRNKTAKGLSTVSTIAHTYRLCTRHGADCFTGLSQLGNWRRWVKNVPSFNSWGRNPRHMIFQ